MKPEAQKQLIKKLSDMFQFDQASLDFGIYRIMSQKRDVIQQFLEKELPDEISKQISYLEDKSTQQELESSIYSHLFEFFSRYYDDGDFISQRRFKDGAYVIPYEGEEVKLHWANYDQYYVKSTEDFSNYDFSTPFGNVTFRIIDITDERDNNKGNKKEFRLVVDDEINNPTLKNNQLVVYFEYVDVKESSQKKTNISIVEKVFEIVRDNPDLQRFIPIFEKKTSKENSIFEKELTKYTAKNTYDYFIHKNLEHFLSHELDVYVKNDVIHLQDLNAESLDNSVKKAQIISVITIKIIKFLSQIENFQKKLWLKKKFVVQTDYCMTLDKVPTEFYEEILLNNGQIEAWKELFSIDNIISENNLFQGDIVPFSDNLTVGFMEQNLGLLLDTQYFDDDFKERLLSHFENLDESLLGWMINSDNSQALNLIREKFRNKVQTTYIDPPYNTVYSKILYKNNFKHSSWLSLLNNTVSNVSDFWTNDFSFGIAIDDYEYTNLQWLLKNQFPNLENSTVIVNHHPQGAGGRLSRTHEYYILLSDTKSPAYFGEPKADETENRAFMRSGRGENNFREFRWRSFYALLLSESSNTIVGVEKPVPLGNDYPLGNTSQGYRRIYPINSRGEERVWRSSYETGKLRFENGELIASPTGTIYQVIHHEAKREVLFSNWTHPKFNAGTQGSTLLQHMGLGGEFDYPKSIETLETGLWAQSFGKKDSLIMDYFAGSGTTGHAVINLNRKDGGNRKFILVEMGDYFDTATRPRIMKAIYSKDWQNGSPTSRNQYLSSIFKYSKLESYEDALNNVIFDKQQISLDLFNGQVYEEYKLNYMLDMESAENDTFLNIDQFSNPFDYNMILSETGELKNMKVDLIETFNYLVGLEISKNMSKENITVGFEKNKLGKLTCIPGDEIQYTVKIITGKIPNNKSAIIIWRTLTDDLIKDNAFIEEYLKTKDVDTTIYENVFINGDSGIVSTDYSKVHVLEQVMKDRMFETEGL